MSGPVLWCDCLGVVFGPECFRPLVLYCDVMV